MGGKVFRMPVAKLREIETILQCPCLAGCLRIEDGQVQCTSENCELARRPFPSSGGQPVLVDFGTSVFARDHYRDGNLPTSPRSGRLARFVHGLREFTYGSNRQARDKASDLIARLSRRPDARLLVIGGGTVGSGADALYRQDKVRIVGTDVFASSITSLIADGHRLPFKHESFDAVWVQAVLEHVLEPQKVADEIHRVLKPGGLVYADTPFMQQVHGGAYDFQRFSASGHRWLFRNFKQIEAGAVGGPGVSMIWSLHYFLLSLGAGNRLATVLTAPFFWLRLADRVSARKAKLAGANGVYFYGTKSDESLSPSDMIGYYEEMNREQPSQKREAAQPQAGRKTANKIAPQL